MPTLKPAEFSSTPNNLNLFDDESVISRLDKKLKHLEIKRNNVVLEKVEPKTSPKQEPTSSNSEQINTKDEAKVETKSVDSEDNKTVNTVVRNTGRQLTSNQKGEFIIVNRPQNPNNLHFITFQLKD